MKRLQLLFTALAILVAGAGVLASARVAMQTTYYRAPDHLPETDGKLCGVEIDPPDCDDISGTQCEAMFETQLSGESFPTLKTYTISKIVEDDDCEEVWRE